MKRTILIIDHDYAFAAPIKKLIRSAIPDVEVIYAFDYQNGARVVAQEELAAMVMDIELPGPISGYQFLEDIRATSHIPVLATGVVEAENRIKAYQLGADLFMTKPVDPHELVAATCALLRRRFNLNHTSGFRHGGMVLHCKGLLMDPHRRRVSLNNRTIVLSPKEFDILYFLASNPQIVLSQETIYERVWKSELTFGSRCITDHISSIRKKLKLRPGDGIRIDTVYSLGYRFVI